MERFSLPLRICFLADKILLVLDELLKEKNIDMGDREVLKEAVQFFEQVRLGKQFVETLRVDTSLIEASSLYGVALDVLLSLKKENKIVGETENILCEYDDVLDTVIKGTSAFSGTKEGLEKLRQFFMVLRAIGLQRIERPVEEVTIIGGTY